MVESNYNDNDNDNELAQNPVIGKEITDIDLDGLTCVWISWDLFQPYLGDGICERIEFDISQVAHLKEFKDH